MQSLIGKKICLWQAEVRMGDTTIRILKQVVVTILEEKTGVLGMYSLEPSTLPSLRAVGEDGKVYEKHWEFWPESSQLGDFVHQWSIRYDGVGGHRVWSPVEAVHIYNAMVSRRMGQGERCSIIGPSGEEDLAPIGDVVYCETHDTYSHEGDECIWCAHTRQNKQASNEIWL